MSHPPAPRASRSVPLRHAFAAAALAVILSPVAARAGEITFSPSPAVAGEPIEVTFAGSVFSCGDEGQLTRSNLVGGNTVTFEVEPPNCPILPPGFTDYTATATIDPLPAGTYQVLVHQDVGSSSVVLDVVELTVLAGPACEATATSLCLDGHFEVTGNWVDFSGNEGQARTVADDLGGLGDHGLLWFFSPENPEILVKVVDACAATGHYWVFVSPGSTVEYEIHVRDVWTGTERTFRKGLSRPSRLMAATSTFACS
jgi:hypothetical protein